MLGMRQWRRVAGTAAAAVAMVLAGAASASAGWLPAVDVAGSSATNADVGNPVVAVAPDGTAFVAFVHGTVIGVAMRNPGGASGAVRDLSGAGSFSPAIAVDRQGDVTLAWHAGDGTIQERYRPAGGDWGAPATLSGGGVFNGPRVATGDNGAAVVAWGRTVAAGPTVSAEARTLHAGTPSPDTLTASTDAPGSQLCEPVKVAMDAAGDVAALWTQRAPDGSTYRVQSAVKAAGAPTFATAEQRSDEPSGASPCGTDIQMTPGGRVLAMWDFRVGVNPNYIEYAERDGASFASATWGPRTMLLPGVETRAPVFAVDDAGSTAATWIQGDSGSGQTVLASAVRAGTGAFTASKPMSGSNFRDARAVATSANGDAIAAFVGASNGGDAIFTARRRSGTEFGEITAVASVPPTQPNIGLSAPDVGSTEPATASPSGGAMTSTA